MSVCIFLFNNNFFQLQVGDLKTPFRNFEDVRFEGQWEKTASGATFKGLGDVNALKHAFEAAYISKASGFSVTWLVVIIYLHKRGKSPRAAKTAETF
jgi:hypothetical protein